jgi:PAS domain S-box-containing protein
MPNNLVLNTLFTENLNAVLDHIFEGVTVQNPKGELIYSNREAARIIGFNSPEELLSTPINRIMQKFLLYDEKGTILNPLDLPSRVAIAKKKSSERMIRFRVISTGIDRWSVVKANPVLDKHNNLIAVVNTFHDITDLKLSEQKLSILVRANKLMTNSLNYKTRLTTLANFAVPTLSDWCAIDILDEHGGLNRLTVVHSDPQKRKFAIDLSRKFPPSATAKHGIRNVIRTGKSEIYLNITPEQIKQSSASPQHWKMLKQLNLQSAVILPLKSRGNTLGAITFAYSDSNRRYDKRTILLLEDLTERAAILIDNARLYDIAKEEIAKQSAAKQVLLENEKRLKLALEVGKMGIWDWDIKTNRLTLSKQIEKILGLPTNFQGEFEDLQKIIYPTDRRLVKRNIDKAIQTDKPYEQEFRIVHPDKTMRWILGKGQVFKTLSGRAERMIGIFMDITARKRWEADIIQKEKKFRSIFDATLDGVIITNNQGQIMDANQSAVRLFQKPLTDLKKSLITSTELYDDNTPLLRDWTKLNRKKAINGELTLIKPDGKTSLAQYHVVPNFVPDRHLVIVRDVTEQRFEEKRREHFLGIASHELKSPLATIKAFIEILKQKFNSDANGEGMKYLDKINDKADQLNLLMNDLLDVTRIRQNKLDLAYEYFSFDQLLKSVIDEIRLLNPDRNIIVSGHTRKFVIADRQRIRQVFNNLVRNAVRYSPSDSKIFLRIQDKRDEIEISIQDFGVGIPKKDLRRVFDLFFQGNDGSNRKAAGLGVGLFISSEIVKQHGGKIRVESEPGVGSTFTFTVPLKPKKILLEVG